MGAAVDGRDLYVDRARKLNRAMKGLLIQVKALHDADPNLNDDDPRAAQLMNTVNEVIRDAQITGDEFQKLMDEGPALAKQYQARQN